jgi:flavorubredoxin
LYVCEATVKQAEKDWQAIVAVEDVIVGHSSWRAEEVREAKQAAYQLWDIWWYAAHLRRHGANEWSDGHEDKLRGHLGEAGFEAGVLPLPFGWR